MSQPTNEEMNPQFDIEKEEKLGEVVRRMLVHHKEEMCKAKLELNKVRTKHRMLKVLMYQFLHYVKISDSDVEEELTGDLSEYVKQNIQPRKEQQPTAGSSKRKTRSEEDNERWSDSSQSSEENS